MVHHGTALAQASGRPELAEAVASGNFEELPPRIQQLCWYALKLTFRPWDMQESDVTALRVEGFSDRDVVDANQVASYFNYVNRVADGLGVELEDRWPRAVRTERRYGLRQRWGAGEAF